MEKKEYARLGIYRTQNNDNINYIIIDIETNDAQEKKLVPTPGIEPGPSA